MLTANLRVAKTCCTPQTACMRPSALSLSDLQRSQHATAVIYTVCTLHLCESKSCNLRCCHSCCHKVITKKHQTERKSRMVSAVMQHCFTLMISTAFHRPSTMHNACTYHNVVITMSPGSEQLQRHGKQEHARRQATSTATMSDSKSQHSKSQHSKSQHLTYCRAFPSPGL